MAKVENVVRRLEDMGYQIRVEKTAKNGVELTAITNMCGTICPVCYFEDVTADGVNDVVAAERIAKTFEYAMHANALTFVDFEAFIKSLTPDSLEARICAKGNAGKNVITIPFLDDLEIYPIITFAFGEEKVGIKITEEIAKNVPWIFPLFEGGGICMNAINNSFKKTKQFDYTDMVIHTLAKACADGQISEIELNRVIKDILKKNVDSVTKILTNNTACGGAIAIADKAALKRLSKDFDDDFYIIPSSVHEIICIKADKVDGDIDQLKNMVLDVNANVLDPLDKLTDSVYFFSRDTNLVTKVM